ncbi:crispr-associated helicase cas3 [Diplodia corticola]|uniref:Crispr-associated helicase cas3 n=1 Tax=Diplodia corticola TaxID=236234 RepID=A0A1J9QMA5_9PEZI|nr:crispr-associated helicase cas3 [Diplodia corticola]OJD29616.1 crispr-associated helicase cas3 [Diplodia corticola]
MPLRDYFVLFTSLDFYQNKTSCDDAFDNDVAGRGVVASLVVSAAATTLLAICAPFLDGIAGYGLQGGLQGCEGVFSRSMNEWLFSKFSQPARQHCDFLRKVLTRVMITLGDQQVLTGIAVLISGYIRAMQNHSQRVEDYARWRYRLVENHFFLIVYLACLSSSSHLAAVVTLKRYLIANKVLAFLRLSLIVLFAMLLTITICLAVPFGPPTILYLSIEEDIQTEQQMCAIWEESYGACKDIKLHRFWLVVFYIVTVVAVLYPYWIAIINTFESWNEELGAHFRSFWQLESKWLPMHWIRKAFSRLDRAGPGNFWKASRRGVKAAFLFLALGSSGEAYCLQILFFSVSLFYVLLQRMSNKPTDDPTLCDLSAGGTKWGFGQILPMILLAAPIVSGVVSYFEIKSDMEKEKRRNQAEEKEALSAEQIA